MDVPGLRILVVIASRSAVFFLNLSLSRMMEMTERVGLRPSAVRSRLVTCSYHRCSALCTLRWSYTWMTKRAVSTALWSN